MNHTSQNRGFTLIELLVVIAIIGMLSSVVLASLNGARVKARDVRRKADMVELRKALEFYYDANNAYPSTGNQWWGNNATYGSHPTSGSTGYIPNLAPTYISVLPLDPKNPVSGDGYLYNSNGTDYALLSHVSPETYPSAGQPFYDPNRPTWAWKISSPGGANW